MAWTIEYTEGAKRNLKKLDKQTARRILDFMDERVADRADPRSIGKALTGLVPGSYWRYRVGDYRIICAFEDDRLRVLVIEIGHRREIYR